ncbi:MAG: hypothetical protein U5L95_00125 [Candidatus Saccharibacteria bacterium]|nr:hypothetical protein [Candidatus Saccharibacteria bacterium]
MFFLADKSSGEPLYGAKVIPSSVVLAGIRNRSDGAPLFVKIDRKRKIPVTTLLRALGLPKKT